MGFSSTLLGLTLSTTLASNAPPAGHAAGTAACTPARLGPNVTFQPEAWRRAAEALVESTATPGLPWSCAGGDVDLVAGKEGATLTVTTADGSAITRQVTSPDDVQPLGEALLARPIPPPPLEITPPPPEEQGAPPAPPRVLLSAVIAPRYAGGSRLIWGGAAIAGAIPIGRRWGGGLWIRFDGIAKRFDEHAPPMRELCLGGWAFRGFGVGPVELRAGLRPSLAVVTQVDRGDRDQTRFSFRLGAELQTIIPITKAVRAVIALDSELAPVEAMRRPPPPHEPGTVFPKYTVGLGAGVEVALR